MTILEQNSILYRNTQKFFDESLKRHGIGYGQVAFLITVNENEGISMTDLSTSGLYDKSTVAKSVRKLEEKGYIRIGYDQHDKRLKKVYTTEKAEKVISDIYLLRKQWMTKVTQNISGEDINNFSQIFSKLADNSLYKMDEEEKKKVCFYGMQKVTLLDYPDHVAATLFTGGCNFKCPFCHNSELVFLPEGTSEISEDKIDRFLSSRKNVLEGICVSGGEPLIHEEIKETLKYIKSFGYHIKLDTNGSYPDRLIDLAESGLVDYVAVDIKNCREKYGQTVGIENYDTSTIEKTVSYLLENHVPYEFRTTVTQEFHTVSDIREIGRWIAGADKYFLQNYRDCDTVIQKGLHPVSRDTLKLMKESAEKYVKNTKIRSH